MKDLKRKWVDQKALAYSQKKKTKKEQDRAQDYITLQILKKKEEENDYNIMQRKILSFKMLLFNLYYA